MDIFFYIAKLRLERTEWLRARRFQSLQISSPFLGHRKKVIPQRTAVMVFRNIASSNPHAHNPSMDLGELFLQFFHTVALGSATVFLLLGIVRLRISRRTPVLIPGKP